jgi:hypothetical protein
MVVRDLLEQGFAAARFGRTSFRTWHVTISNAVNRTAAASAPRHALIALREGELDDITSDIRFLLEGLRNRPNTESARCSP